VRTIPEFEREGNSFSNRLYTNKTQT